MFGRIRTEPNLGSDGSFPSQTLTLRAWSVRLGCYKASTLQIQTLLDVYSWWTMPNVTLSRCLLVAHYQLLFSGQYSIFRCGSQRPASSSTSVLWLPVPSAACLGQHCCRRHNVILMEVTYRWTFDSNLSRSTIFVDCGFLCYATIHLMNSRPMSGIDTASRHFSSVTYLVSVFFLCLLSCWVFVHIMVIARCNRSTVSDHRMMLIKQYDTMYNTM